MKVTEVLSLLPQAIPWPTNNHPCHFILFSFLSLALNHQPHLFSAQLALDHAPCCPIIHPFFLKPVGEVLWQRLRELLHGGLPQRPPLGDTCCSFLGLPFTCLLSPWVLFSGSACLAPKQARAFLFKSPEFWRNKIL